jgi:hypothetical protein
MISRLLADRRPTCCTKRKSGAPEKPTALLKALGTPSKLPRNSLETPSKLGTSRDKPGQAGTSRRYTDAHGARCSPCEAWRPTRERHRSSHHPPTIFAQVFILLTLRHEDRIPTWLHEAQRVGHLKNQRRRPEGRRYERRAHASRWRELLSVILGVEKRRQFCRKAVRAYHPHAGRNVRRTGITG